MRKLDTVQKVQKLNEVYAVDQKGNGGANHRYLVSKNHLDSLVEPVGEIVFQNGPRHNATSTQGILDCDLLEIVRDRLTSFQNGEFSCSQNEKALQHINLALMHMNRRVEDRIERNVLGQYEK